MDLSGFHTDIEENAVETDDRISLLSSATAELRSVLSLGDALQPAWEKLAHNVSEPNVFYESWFMGAAFAQFDHHADLHLFLLWAGAPENSDLLGLLPLGPTGRLGRWPVPHVQNWMHHNCFLGTPLVRAGFENQFWAALFMELDAASWPGFFHINGLAIGGLLDQALRAVCKRQKRRCDLVHSEARAMLQSDLDPGEYYTRTVRSKKRKELRRQARRLGEMGELQFSHQNDDSGLGQWIDDFLKLEHRGWKGQGGSALDCSDQTRAFFQNALAGAARAGQLERHDLRLDGKPLAMLVNFHSGPGSFSFKTAFDEEYARFSPGVLLQLENLKILDNPEIAWMDSCAAEDHPMIDSLWSGRRHIGRFSIELSGTRRKTIFRSIRLGEDLMAQIKGREIIDVMKVIK